MTALDILAAARERLLAKGWSPGIGRCLLMTIEAVVEDDAVWYGPRPQDKALAALRGVIGEQSLVTWNARQPSVTTVIEAIDLAIKALESTWEGVLK